jgi:hypothetical protein
LAKYLRKEGFSKTRNKIFLGNHLKERKDEVQRFKLQMVALGSSEFQFLKKTIRRERERCKVRDIRVRVLR